MHFNLAYFTAAILLFNVAFLFDYNVRQLEKLAQQDSVKEFLIQRFGHFPYNQRKMLPLRSYLSTKMASKYEQMCLDGYKMIDIQMEIERDANRFVDNNMQ
jgi:uncharacterized protein (DUF1919 family)